MDTEPPSPSRNSLSDFRLFEPLLALLRLRGFPIGVDDYLRLQVLLERVSPESLLTSSAAPDPASEPIAPDPEGQALRLKRGYADLLRPLFASTPEQQRQFDSLFDDAWPNQLLPYDSEQPEPASELPPLPPPRERDSAAVDAQVGEWQSSEAEPEESEATTLQRRAKLAALKRRSFEQHERAHAAEEGQAQAVEKEVAQAADKARSAARAARLLRTGILTASALAAVCLLSLFGARVWRALERLRAKPVQYEWADQSFTASANRVAMVSAQPSAAGAFPVQTLALPLKREDGRPFTLQESDGIRLALPHSATPPFTLTIDKTERLRPAAVQRAVLRFAPTAPGVTVTHITVRTGEVQDMPAPSLEVRGQAFGFHPPPKNIYVFSAGSGQAADALTLPLLPVGDSRSAQITLFETQGHPFRVTQAPAIQGADKDLFAIRPVSGSSASAAAHRYSVIFHPTRPYQAAFLDAQLTYRSGATDSQDPPDLPIRIDRAEAGIATATAAIEVESRAAGTVATRLSPWIAAAAALVSVCAGLAGLILLRRRSARPRADRNDLFAEMGPAAPRTRGAPFEAPLRSGSDLRPFHGARFAEAAALLSPPVRLDDHVDVLDVGATVRATAQRAGFPTPIFRPRRAHPPEYLLLIHRRNSRDVRADYFTAFARALVRQGVSVKTLYYAASPDLCYDTEGLRSYRLDRLHRLVPRRRVIVFGELHPFVDLHDGAVTHAARTLALWPVRALFTLDDLTSAGLRLRALQEDESIAPFPVLPATQAGQRRFVQMFPVNSAASKRTRRAVSETASDGEEEDGPLPALPDPAVLGAAEFVAALRDAVGPDRRVYLWLCACALYPRLFYDLTILIGMRIEAITDDPEPLVTTDNLRLLLRISGFEVGLLTDESRLAMQEQLRMAGAEGAVVEREIRTLLVRLLETPPLPPANSVAFDRFRLERSVQAWLLSQKEHAPGLRRQMRRLSAFVVETHPALRALLARPETDLWADQTSAAAAAGRPGWLDEFRRRWRALRYKEEMPYRDRLPRLTPYAGLLGLGAVVFGALALAPFGPRVDTTALSLNATSSQRALRFGVAGPNTALEANLRVHNRAAAPIEVEAAFGQSGSGGGGIREVVGAGLTEIVTVPLPASTGGASGSMPDVRVGITLDPAANRGTAAQNITLPVELRRRSVRFDRDALVLKARSPLSPLSGTINLIGPGLPEPPDLFRLLTIDPGGEFHLKPGRRTTGSGDEIVQPIIVMYTPAARATAVAIQAILTYRDNAGTEATASITASYTPTVAFHASPQRIVFPPGGILPEQSSVGAARRAVTVTGPSTGRIDAARIESDSAHAFWLSTGSTAIAPQLSRVPLAITGKRAEPNARLFVVFKPTSPDPATARLRLTCIDGGRATDLLVALRGATKGPDPVLASGSVVVGQTPALRLSIRPASYATSFRDKLSDSAHYTVDLSPSRTFVSTARASLQVVGAPVVRDVNGALQIQLTVQQPGGAPLAAAGGRAYLRVGYTGASAGQPINRRPLILMARLPAARPIPVTVVPVALDLGPVRDGVPVSGSVTLSGPADVRVVSARVVDVTANATPGPTATASALQKTVHAVLPVWTSLVRQQATLNKEMAALTTTAQQQPDFLKTFHAEGPLLDEVQNQLNSLQQAALPVSLRYAMTDLEKRIGEIRPAVDDKTSISLDEAAKAMADLSRSMQAVQTELAKLDSGNSGSGFTTQIARQSAAAPGPASYIITINWTPGAGAADRAWILRILVQGSHAPVDVPISFRFQPRPSGGKKS